MAIRTLDIQQLNQAKAKQARKVPSAIKNKTHSDLNMHNPRAAREAGKSFARALFVA